MKPQQQFDQARHFIADIFASKADQAEHHTASEAPPDEPAGQVLRGVHIDSVQVFGDIFNLAGLSPGDMRTVIKERALARAGERNKTKDNGT